MSVKKGMVKNTPQKATKATTAKTLSGNVLSQTSRQRVNYFKSSSAASSAMIARVLGQTSIPPENRPGIISSPLGPLVTPRGRNQKLHYDLIAANEYCKQRGKSLRDLTEQEREQFQITAEAIKPKRR